MPKNSGMSSASVSSVPDIPNPIKIPLPDSYPNYDHIPNPWDTPEYEALCRADRERADSERADSERADSERADSERADSERFGPKFHSSFKGRTAIYSRDTFAHPNGWDTCRPKPTFSEWCGAPLFGLNCTICGSSKHIDVWCAYLMEFPKDGHLLNHEKYKIVCLCGLTIVQGGCPSGYCYSNTPMRVVQKKVTFVDYGIDHVSHTNSFGFSDPYPLIPLSSDYEDGYDADISFERYCELYPGDPNVFAHP